MPPLPEKPLPAALNGIAYAVYQLAMSDDMLPRFTKEAMPARPQPATP
jgi:hypothetical protein